MKILVLGGCGFVGSNLGSGLGVSFLGVGFEGAFVCSGSGAAFFPHPPRHNNTASNAINVAFMSPLLHRHTPLATMNGSCLNRASKTM